MKRKILFFFIFSPLFLFSKAADGNPFPEIPGWKMAVIDRVYTSDDLWELINGAADIFLSYYFENLNIAEYSKNDQMIRVELYRHKTHEDTYGIYSSERMPDYTQVKAGAQGYKSQGVLNFFTGNYYVKIMSAGVEEADEQTIALVAEKVDALLNLDDSMPETLNLFPNEGKVYLSDTYIAQNFMGYSFFNHAFVMRYDKPAEFQMFIVKLPSEQTAKMTEQYLEMVKKENVTEDNDILVVKDPYNGTVYLRQLNGCLVGVSGTENPGIAREYIDKAVSGIIQ